MTVRVEHLLLPSRNQRRAAAFLAELLDLEVSGASSGAPDGYFSVVRVGDITIDYADMERFSSHHVAFAVEDETFRRDLRTRSSPRARVQRRPCPPTHG